MGAPRDTVLETFTRHLDGQFRSVMADTPADETEHGLRRRAHRALEAAQDAAQDMIVRNQNFQSGHVPANTRIAMLDDVHLGIHSLIVLLERDVYRPQHPPPVHPGEHRAGAPVHRWRGPGVRIVETAWTNYTGDSTLVVTAHASSLGGLFDDLLALAAPAIASPMILQRRRTSSEFFVRTARAADAWLEQQPETDAVDLMLAAACEARSVIEVWQDQAAPPASGPRDCPPARHVVTSRARQPR